MQTRNLWDIGNLQNQSVKPVSETQPTRGKKLKTCQIYSNMYKNECFGIKQCYLHLCSKLVSFSCKVKHSYTNIWCTTPKRKYCYKKCVSWWAVFPNWSSLFLQIPIKYIHLWRYGSHRSFFSSEILFSKKRISIWEIEWWQHLPSYELIQWLYLKSKLQKCKILKNHISEKEPLEVSIFL